MNDASIHVERPLLAALRASLEGDAVRYHYVVGAPGTGKTLLSRALADTDGTLTDALYLRVDLAELRVGRTAERDDFYRGILELGARACEEAGVPGVSPRRSVGGATAAWALLFRDLARKIRGERKVIVVIDNFDRAFWHGAADWMRSFDKAIPEERFGAVSLRFCAFGVLGPNDPELGLGASRWTVHALDDLDPGETAELVRRALPAAREDVARAIHAWTRGHLAFTRRLCQDLRAQALGADAEDQVYAAVRRCFFERTRGNDGAIALERADAALAAMVAGARRASSGSTLEVYRQIFAGRWEGGAGDEKAKRVELVLRGGGLVVRRGDRLRVRNRIFEAVFDDRSIALRQSEARLQDELDKLSRGATPLHWDDVVAAHDRSTRDAGLRALVASFTRAHEAELAEERRAARRSRRQAAAVAIAVVLLGLAGAASILQYKSAQRAGDARLFQSAAELLRRRVEDAQDHEKSLEAALSRAELDADVARASAVSAAAEARRLTPAADGQELPRSQEAQQASLDARARAALAAAAAARLAAAQRDLAQGRAALDEIRRERDLAASDAAVGVDPARAKEAREAVITALSQEREAREQAERALARERDDHQRDAKDLAECAAQRDKLGAEKDALLRGARPHDQRR